MNYGTRSALRPLMGLEALEWDSGRSSCGIQRLVDRFISWVEGFIGLFSYNVENMRM